MRLRTRPRTFADFELQAQGVALDATLQAMTDFLDAHEDLVTLVHQDLVRGLKRRRTGPEGLGAPQVLRAFVLQRIKAWDLRERRERIADGYTLRRFTTFDACPVPKHDAFHRAFGRLTPATVRALNDAVVQAAVGLGLENGARLRVDTTVVETNIHWPTDSGLLWDAVRVLTRLVKRLGQHVPTARRGFADRTRRARRRMQELHRLSPAERPRQQTWQYRDLLRVTAGVVVSARAAVAMARAAPPADPLAAAAVTALGAEIEHFCGLAERVMTQTRRRVLHGEQVRCTRRSSRSSNPTPISSSAGRRSARSSSGTRCFWLRVAAGSSPTTGSSTAIPSTRGTSRPRSSSTWPPSATRPPLRGRSRLLHAGQRRGRDGRRGAHRVCPPARRWQDAGTHGP
jgi:IS5 family transposase